MPSPPQISWDLYPRAGDVQPHEPLECYTPGGFHPVTLGDTFQNGRYIIRHKLGYGGFSTVWLARDEQEERWVSVKIKQARVSSEDFDTDSEISILRKLEKHYANGPKDRPRYFVRLLDCFHHTGPNGIHNCLVMEFVGPTIRKVLGTYSLVEETLRPDTVLRASRQLLEGLQQAHEAGIVHGDVSPSNIAFTCYNFLDSEDELFEAMGGEMSDPITANYESQELRQPPHLPSHVVKSADWNIWYDTPQEDIRLIDWGLSYPIGQTVSSIAQPIDLRTPETFFLPSIDYRSDLWRAGCVIYASYYQALPFNFVFGPDCDYIMRLVKRLGPLPPEWHAKWEEMLKTNKDTKENFRGISSETILETFEPRYQTIITVCEKEYEDDQEKYVKDDYTVHDCEMLKCLLPIMQGLLQYDPEKRPSLSETLSHIHWRDYRREFLGGNSGEDEGHGREEEDDAAGGDKEDEDACEEKKEMGTADEEKVEGEVGEEKIEARQEDKGGERAGQGEKVTDGLD